MINEQLDSNNDMVNVFLRRLKEFNFSQTTDDAFGQLSQWRDDCHKNIDKIYGEKLEELNSYIQEIKTMYDERTTNIKNRISKLSDQSNLEKVNDDFIQKEIDSIEQEVSNIEKISIKIKTQTLPMNDNYVSIEKEFNLQNISKHNSQFYYTYECSSALASSDQHLLMHQHPNLYLIEQDLKISNVILWPHGWIRDMCWSKTLRSFIIITSSDIYVLNEFQKLSNDFKPLGKQHWFSCTCSDQSLYLSTCESGSSILEFKISTSFDLVKQWTPPLTCEKDDGINDIKYNNETIALMINDLVKLKKCMVLKSVKTFDTIWSLSLSVGSSILLFTCCPIEHNEWLVIDGTNCHVYHVTENGAFKNDTIYTPTPYRANLFNSNILAIADENNLKFYRGF